MSAEAKQIGSEPDLASSLSSATIHEAAGGIGALRSSIKPLSSKFRISGAAFTVKSPPADNLWLHRAIYAAPPGSVLVASVGGFREAGHWGAVMGHAALARKLAGLVIDGGVRDSRELIAMGFPVFASNLCIRGTSKDVGGEGSFGEQILIGDITINSGDLVVGDADGVVVIPRRLVPQVLENARFREEKERTIFSRLARGERTLDIYKFDSATDHEKER